MKEYLATLAVGIILAVIVGFIIFIMIKNRKKRKASGQNCTGDCMSCGRSCCK